MIQQMNMNLKCYRNDHGDDIEMICLNQLCTEFRFMCFKCLKLGFHQNHSQDFEKIINLSDFINDRNLECDDLVKNQNQLLENVNHQYSLLITGIKQKYQLQGERLNQLKLEQINDLLNSMITFREYQHSIRIIIEEQTKKLINTFNNLLQQLQLPSLSYYQKDNNNEENSKQYYDEAYNLELEIVKLSIYETSDKQLEVIKIIEKSLELNKNNHLSLSLKGRCIKMMNKYEESLIWLDKALAIDPKHVNSLSEKGECLRLLKQFFESQKFFDQALTVDPIHQFSLTSKGDCLQDQGNYKEQLIMKKP